MLEWHDCLSLCAQFLRSTKLDFFPGSGLSLQGEGRGPNSLWSTAGPCHHQISITSLPLACCSLLGICLPQTLPDLRSSTGLTRFSEIPRVLETNFVGCGVGGGVQRTHAGLRVTPNSSSTPDSLCGLCLVGRRSLTEVLDLGVPICKMGDMYLILPPYQLKGTEFPSLPCHCQLTSGLGTSPP